MSRRDEVEAVIKHGDEYSAFPHAHLRDLARTLADEVDELRGDRGNAVKNAMDAVPDAPWKDYTATEAVWLLSLAMAGIVSANADLRGKLDDVRSGIGCARGQQYCAEAAQRDEIIGKLLEMLVVPEDDPDQWAAACDECGWLGMSMSCGLDNYEAGDCDVLCPECGAPVDELGCIRQVMVARLHARALEIAGRKE